MSFKEEDMIPDDAAYVVDTELHVEEKFCEECDVRSVH